MRKPIIYFSRVGMAKDGRGLYKLCDGNGKTYGRRFKIYPQPCTRPAPARRAGNMIDIESIEKMANEAGYNVMIDPYSLKLIAAELRASRALRLWAGETRKAFSTSTYDDFLDDVCKACTAYDKAVGKLT